MIIRQAAFVLLVFAGAGDCQTPGAEAVLRNLPAHEIGPKDLLSVSVYDAPELTRTVRVGDDGLIECKSRGQKFQVQTLCEFFESGTTPDDFMLQVQGQMLITERQWCDLVSYSGGLPMVVMRVHPMPHVQQAILDAAAKFEARINETVATWTAALASDLKLIPTERKIEQEMVI